MADSSTVNGFRLRLVQSGTTLILYGISDYPNYFWANVTFGGSGSGTKRIDWSGEGTKELHRWSVGTSTSNRTYTATINNDYPGYVSVSLTVPGVNPLTPPAAPYGFSITRQSASEITLAWTKGARATETIIDCQFDYDGKWYQLASPTGTSQKVVGLRPNGYYRFRARSWNRAGSSGNVTVGSDLFTKVPTPTNVKLKGVPNAVIVQWDSTARYRYAVEIQPEGGTIQTFPTAEAVARSATLSGTFSGNTRFRVRTSTSGSGIYKQTSEWSAWSPRVQDVLVALPQMEAIAERSTGTTANPLGTNIRVVAKIAADKISGNKMTLKARYREKGATTWGGWTTTLNAVAASSTTRTFVLSGAVSVLKSYEVEIVFSDSYSTTTQLVEVATGEVALSLGKTGVGVGKIWERGALDVNGDTHIAGNLHVTGAVSLDTWEGCWVAPFTLTGWAQQGTSGVWRGSILNLPLPITVPDSHDIEVFISQTTGFTVASSAGLSATRDSVSVRVIQIGSGDTTAFVRIGWRLYSK